MATLLALQPLAVPTCSATPRQPIVMHMATLLALQPLAVPTCSATLRLSKVAILEAVYGHGNIITKQVEKILFAVVRVLGSCQLCPEHQLQN
jgi:hypothetical protein